MDTKLEACPIWVCTDCAQLLANGECEDGVTPVPCNLLSFDAHMGMDVNAHFAGCAIRTTGECDYECETIDFSSGRCDGCGSWLAGTRHAAIEWIAS